MITLSILGLGFFAGFTIFLGLPVARMRSPSLLLRGFLNAIALGILLFLFVDVVQNAWWNDVEPSFLQAHHAGGSYGSAVLFLVVFVLGFGGSLLGLAAFEHRMMRSRPATTPDPQAISIMIATGIGLHNFGEGLAIGASAASGAIALALVLGIGFALHNATEGFGIAAPLAGQRPTWSFLLYAGLIGGGPTVVGTLVGALVTNAYLEVLFLSLAAGAILYVVKELFHQSRRIEGGHAVLAMAGVTLGLLLGLGTDLIVSIGGA
ncbi:MAG: ZIP family metal transporter [Thermoplasmatota archaeon]